MGTEHQAMAAHAQAKVGYCPFCRSNTAELWFDPADDYNPFQVRCSACGARGPTGDCGWENAVPSWDGVRAYAGDDRDWRGPGSDAPDPHKPLAPVEP